MIAFHAVWVGVSILHKGPCPMVGSQLKNCRFSQVPHGAVFIAQSLRNSQ